MASSRIKGITVEIGGDTTRLSSALKGLDTDLSKTQSQLRDVDKLLKLDPHNTELLRQKQQLLAQAVGDTSERLNKLKEARKSAEENLGNYDKWKEKYEPVRTEIEKTSKKLNELKVKRDELEKSGDISSDEYKALSAQIDDTAKHLDELKKKQKEINDEFGNPISPEQYNALKREIIDTESKLKDLETQAAQSSVAIQKIAQAGEGLKSLGGKITDAGKALAPVSGVAAVGLGAAAKAAIDYETAFTGVMKTNDELIDENGNVIVSYEDLSDAIKDLSTRTAASKNDIAAVMEGAGQLGVGTEYLADFTEAMVMLGDTTNLSADEAATAIAKFANITNMSLDNADRLGAALVDLGNNFATDEQSIMEMATRLAGAGHQIGLSEAEILGFATALSSVGIEAEMGGSAFSKAMIKMQVATETGYDALDKINEHSDDFKAKVNRTIAELKAKIADLQQQRTALAEQGETGTDADKAIESQIKQTEKLIKSFDKELQTVRESGDETGVTLRGLQMLMYNNSKDFKGFADNIGLTAKELTDLVNSASQLENFAEVAQMSVDEFTELFKNDAPAAMDAFIRGLGDTDTAGESTIQMLQDMGFTEVRLRDTLTRAASAQDLFSNAVQAGNDAWNENSALTAEAEKRYGTMEAKISQVLETVSNVAIDFGEIMLPIISDILDKVKQAVEWFGGLDDNTKKIIATVGLVVAAIGPLLIVIGQVVSSVGGIMAALPALGAAFGGMAAPIAIAVAAVAALTSTVADGLGVSLEDMANAAKDVMGRIVDGILTGIPLLTDAAVKTLQGFADYLRKNLPTLIKSGLEIALKLAESIRENAGKLVDAAIGLAKALAKGLADSIPIIIQNLPAIVSAIAGVINDNAPKILKAGIDIMITLVKGIIDSIPVIVANIPQIIKAIVDVITAFNWLALGSNIITAIKNGFVAMKTAIPDTLHNIANSAKDLVKNIKWGELGSSIVNTIKGGIVSLAKAIPEALKSIAESAVKAFTDIDWKQIGKDLLTGIWNGITSVKDWLLGNVGKLVTSVMDAFTGKEGFDENSPSKWAKKVGGYVTEGLADGLSGNASDAIAAANQTVRSVQNAFSLDGLASLLRAANASTMPIQAALSVPLPSTYYNASATRNAQIPALNQAYANSANAIRPAPVRLSVNNIIGGAAVSRQNYQYDAAESARRGPSFVKR